jgi:uncharacterized membrane protein
MIIFHFAYHLNFFDLVELNLRNTFWTYFRYLLVSIFMISVGISLAIVHTPTIRWGKVAHRTWAIGASALIVTGVTIVQSPQAWVYFGILHMILTASLVGLLFVGQRIAVILLTAILIFSISYTTWFWDTQSQCFLWIQPLLHLPNSTRDMAHFFPWFGAVLIGISLYRLGWHQYLFSLSILNNHNRINTILSFCGRHALMIYLLHLPIIYGVLMGGKYLLNQF